MFEGQPPLSGSLHAPKGGDGSAENLRPLRWDELVARLSAVRDLQAELLPCDQEGEGSFDADSARKIAAHQNGKLPVNLEGSANLKEAGGTGVSAKHDSGRYVPQGAVRK